MLEKCKALAKKTHQSSSVANQALKDKCKSMGVKFAKLQNPNQTRWNSQLTNMESVLRLKAPLQELFEEDETGAWYDVSLTAADWKLMQGAVTLLKPFLFATKAWEAECLHTNDQLGHRTSLHHPCQSQRLLCEDKLQACIIFCKGSATDAGAEVS